MALDKTIWIRISQDDKVAYSEAYRYFYQKFFNYGRKFSADLPLIEDAIQETLLLLWNKRKTLSSIDYVVTYYYGAFRNILLSKIKIDNRINANAPPDEVPDFSIEQIIINKEMDDQWREQLSKAISLLTPRQREAIFLRFYERLSYEEVSSVLAISTKATYKIIARALTELKDTLTILICIMMRFL